MLPVSAQAQDGAAAAASEPAADRLAAATQLIGVIMPAEQRDAMVDQMMKAVSRRKTTRKAMQPKGAVETGIQRLPRLPQARRMRMAIKKATIASVE